jgi:serine/threonine protein kinase
MRIYSLYFEFFSYSVIDNMDSVCFFNIGYKYNKSSDIYSLGLILWEISSGKTPRERNKEALVNLIPVDYNELYESAWSDDSKNDHQLKRLFEALKILILTMYIKILIIFQTFTLGEILLRQRKKLVYLLLKVYIKPYNFSLPKIKHSLE